MSDTRTHPDTVDVSADPDQVHHHSADALTWEQYERHISTGLPFRARCGAVRPAVRNPIALPCCPRCAAVLARASKTCEETW